MFGSFLIWGARERPFSSGLSAWELTPPIPQPQMRRIRVKIYTKVYLIVWFFYRYLRSVTSIGYQYNMSHIIWQKHTQQKFQTDKKFWSETLEFIRTAKTVIRADTFCRPSLIELCANNYSFPEKINVNGFLMIIQAQSSARKNFALSYKPVMRQSLDIFMYFRHVIWVFWPSSWFQIIFMISFLIKFLQMVISIFSQYTKELISNDLITV